jgi:hypothetical protein
MGGTNRARLDLRNRIVGCTLYLHRKRVFSLDSENLNPIRRTLKASLGFCKNGVPYRTESKFQGLFWYAGDEGFDGPAESRGNVTSQRNDLILHVDATVLFLEAPPSLPALHKPIAIFLFPRTGRDFRPQQRAWQKSEKYLTS